MSAQLCDLSLVLHCFVDCRASALLPRCCTAGGQPLPPHRLLAHFTSSRSHPQVPSAWPALVRTGSQMAQYGTTLALVGGTFAAVDVSHSVELFRLLACMRLGGGAAAAMVWLCSGVA